jgi:N-acetylglucosaminyldiphosphoundecaprenol N-acetyl-beta-D-mannosaminyltransferase
VASPSLVAAGGEVRARRRERVRIGGVFVDKVDLSDAAATVRGFLRGGVHQIVTVNLDFLRLAASDAAFRETLNSADLAVPDGIPLVWLSRLARDPLPERVAGVDLVEDCCRMAAELGRSVFLLGASESASRAAATRLRQRYPTLRVDRYSPAFGPISVAENDRIVRLIRDADPAFLFVALGAPRQDLWIRERLHTLGVPVAIGVGCVVDLLAGRVHRAPSAVQRAGLEWLFRLLQEPTRLWRRYLLHDVPLLFRLMLNAKAGAVRE